jgi:ADP-heptose:LPS heptosyltransferase
MVTDSKRKILICNTAYIGDVILSTSVLPVLKSFNQEIEIGFLASNSGSIAIKDHTLIDHVHIFNHPTLNRNQISKKLKQKEGAKSFRKALEEINKVNYDIAIDLYSIFPSSSKMLLYRSNISFRIGWAIHQNPYYFNHLIPIPDLSIHIVERYRELLKCCGIEDCYLKHLKPTLTYHTKAKNIAIAQSFIDEGFIVIHMGTGDIKREWSNSNWIALCQKLEEKGFNILFIGSGQREQNRVKLVSQHLKASVDLCGKIGFKEVLEVIKKSRLIVGLESMIVHAASSFDLPIVAIYGGYYKISRWRPYHENGHVIMPPNQYFNKFGLTPKTAIDLITPKQVLEKILEVLKR